jgi:PHD/YefM family antitoxin component YafN of YafNO toxin-antitoxin module
MTGKLRVVTGRQIRPRARRLAGVVEGPERELLVVLREKLAAVLDGGVPVYVMMQLTRQLLSVDGRIRAIDARAAEEAAAADEPDDDLDDEAGWDPSTL